jgi:hypothetical protein
VPNGPTTTPARAVRAVGASGAVAAVPSSRPFPRRSRARRPAGSTTCARPRRKAGRSAPASVPAKPGPASPGGWPPVRTRLPPTTSRSRAAPTTDSRTTLRTTATAPGDGRRRRDSGPVRCRVPPRSRRVLFRPAPCRPGRPRPALVSPAPSRPVLLRLVPFRPVSLRPVPLRAVSLRPVLFRPGVVVSGPVRVTRGNVRAVCRPVRCRRGRSAQIRCRPVEFRAGRVRSTRSRAVAGVARVPPGSGRPVVLRPAPRCPVRCRPGPPGRVRCRPAPPCQGRCRPALSCPARCRPVRVFLVRCPWVPFRGRSRRVLAVVVLSRVAAVRPGRRRVVAAGRSRRIRPGRCTPGSHPWVGRPCRPPATRPRSR